MSCRSNPGLRPYVEAGISRLATYNSLDNYGDNWWSGIWSGEIPNDPGNRIDDTQAALRISGYQLKALPGITQQQHQTAIDERSRLAKLPAAPALLGRRVLDYAKAHPGDPTVPEALHLAVRATSFGQGRNDGSKDPETTAVSKAAFQLLHARYPKSPWTAKTPYYF